jgi:RNase H-fold protein (predicted Holliday junction resolvase)
VTAERSLGNARLTRARRREVVDKVAAAVMLQSWLDATSR